ncbi:MULTISPECIES: LytTR family DNA-binding domain-containing protein [Cycloclasticus]|uniref:Alginate biosynthesis regulatory protein AlgR-like protein n=1 Tax=Cycloclasticus pugetii TaxID=34068 RepID=A0AB33YZ39_9GAMM|nr:MULTISPECIES: response regulator [Cycloclasticus]ATI02352.1 DNA-binding response regulator [Cycloclasticus sp. PY97N]EPD12441.1 alginate biosynthesis regulatory protein AlgR-like protein [Cycloclasticus pugetii]
MKILIADDEPLARQRLKRLVDAISSHHTVYADASNGVDALKQCIDIQPELALLDIRMPKMDGLQTATEIANAQLKTRVVFVTAYDEYAIEAFDKNAIDYLLKPVKQARLDQAIDKAAQYMAQPINIKQAAPLLSRPRQHLCAHTHHGLKVLNVNDILFFKADHKYVLAATATESILIEDSLKLLEEEFGTQFFRIHRNALVNTTAIHAITKSASGQFELQLKGYKDTLSISRRHKAELNRFLRQKD